MQEQPTRAGSPVEVEDIYVCPFCGSLLALAIQPGSTHPEDGLWACPSCRRVECGQCDREARFRMWDDGGASTDIYGHSATRSDIVVCGRHAGGMKRRTWNGMHLSEPLEVFFARCAWRTPVWLRKYALRDVNDGHVGYIELRDEWMGLFQPGCSCGGRSARGFESIREAGKDVIWHLVRQVGRVPRLP